MQTSMGGIVCRELMQREMAEAHAALLRERESTAEQTATAAATPLPLPAPTAIIMYEHAAMSLMAPGPAVE